MQPIVQTLEVMADLDLEDGSDLVRVLSSQSVQMHSLVPDVVGMSVGTVEHDLTLTTQNSSSDDRTETTEDPPTSEAARWLTRYVRLSFCPPQPVGDVCRSVSYLLAPARRGLGHGGPATCLRVAVAPPHAVMAVWVPASPMSWSRSATASDTAARKRTVLSPTCRSSK